jgi:hypothetical protein
VFTAEKETDMDLILITSRAGSYQTIFAKIISSILFAVFVSVWFCILDYVAFYFIYPITGDITAPLYVLQDFAGTPLNISLGTYIFVTSLFKTIGIISVCMCYLFIANMFKNALLPFICSFMVSIGFLICLEIYSNSSHTFLKTCNPFTLIANWELFRKIEFVNVFGLPITSFIFALVMCGLWIVVFGFLLLLTSRKNSVKGKKKI